MQVIEFFGCDDQKHWLDQIKKSDWRAGQFLYEKLSKNKFAEIAGKDPKVFLLTDKDELISFCTFTQKDDIQPTELTPWIGFVYTFPEYRGHRYIGELFREIERTAAAEGVQEIFLSTNHNGLYEKYGFEFYQIMNDIDGEPSKVYKKHIDIK